MHTSTNDLTKRLETLIFLHAAEIHSILKCYSGKRARQPHRIFLESWKTESAFLNSLTKFRGCSVGFVA